MQYLKKHIPVVVRFHGIPILLYTILAILMTWPLAAQFSTSVPGDGVDCWQNMWNMWWLKQALLEGQNPFYTTKVHYPDGASLLLHTLNPFNFFISLPIHALFGLVVAYNFALLFSLVASGYATYLLAFDVIRNRYAAFLSGVVFAYSGYMLAQALGHLNLIAAEWIPFSVLALRHASITPSVKRIVFAGGLLALNVACDWQYFLFVLIWCVWYSIALLWHRHFGSRFVHNVLPVVAAVGIAMLLVLPVLIPTAELSSRTPRADTGESYRIGTSADLTDFLIPSQLHPWWGKKAEEAQFYKTDTIIHNKTAYLGMVALALAVIGVLPMQKMKKIATDQDAQSFQCRKKDVLDNTSLETPIASFWYRPSFWLLSMLVFILMSLGPLLQIGGVVTHIPLPATLFYKLPLVRISRVPLRFVVVAMLALAMGASFGTRRLLDNMVYQVRMPRLAQGMLVVALAGLIVLDNFTAPYPMVGIYVPSVYAEIGQEEDDYAILEMPFYARTSVIYMFYQAVHNKAIVGGNLSRSLAYPMMNQFPIIRMFAYADSAPDIVGVDMDETASSFFSYFNIRYLILHSEGGSLSYNTIVKVAYAAAGGSEPRYVTMPERSFMVFRVQEPEDPVPFIGVGDGWSEPIPHLKGSVIRYIQDTGELLVYSALPREVMLDIRLHSTQDGIVQLFADGVALPSVSLEPGVQHIKATLSVHSGVTSLALKPNSLGDVAVERVLIDDGRID